MDAADVHKVCCEAADACNAGYSVFNIASHSTFNIGSMYVETLRVEACVRITCICSSTCTSAWTTPYSTSTCKVSRMSGLYKNICEYVYML